MTVGKGFKSIQIHYTSFLSSTAIRLALRDNPFPTIHNNCRLLSLLLEYFHDLYCKQYGPRSDCSLRSSLIRVHSDCFCDEISLECFVWFDSLRPSQHSVTSGRVFRGWTSTKLGLVCLAQGHNAVTPMRLEPPALRSLVKQSTTEPLSSHSLECIWINAADVVSRWHFLDKSILAG